MLIARIEHEAPDEDRLGKHSRKIRVGGLKPRARHSFMGSPMGIMIMMKCPGIRSTGRADHHVPGDGAREGHDHPQ
jgi:hypothetical protein